MMQMYRSIRILSQSGLCSKVEFRLPQANSSTVNKRYLSSTNSEPHFKMIRNNWNITVVQDESDSFALRLNGKGMKTPMNNLLKVRNETLAHAIANEWRCRSQEKKLNITSMYLTTMAYESIDNPFSEELSIVIESILDYLKFDTVRFRDSDNQELLAKQSRHWDPIVGWFEHEFQCHLPIDYNALTNTNTIPRCTLDSLKQYLLSHTRWPLIGARFMTQNLKSFILATSLMTRFLRPEQAVELARLETEHQTDKWTKVEWEHDVDVQCTNARVAAGSLFYHLTLD